MSVNAYSALSTFLHNNWALSSPTKTQIDWLTLRHDVKNWIAPNNTSSNNVMIGCFSSRSPPKRRISNNAFEVRDTVEVQVYVKNQGSMSANATLRDTVYNAVESLILANPNGVLGVNITDPYTDNSIEQPALAVTFATILCRYIEGT